MRSLTVLAAGLILAAASPSTAAAQADTTKAKPATPAAGPVGTWRGAITTPNGSMDVNAIFKKDSTGYSGTISGPEGDVAMHDIAVDGENVTAGALISMQGQSIQLWYTWVLKGDTMTGSVSANFGGQAMAFDLTMRRVGDK